MPTPLFSFPFQVAMNGSIATQLDDSPEYFESELQVMMLTGPGERQLAPTYGMEDPVFDAFPVTTLRAQIEKFGPPVQIADVQTVQQDEKTVSIVVTFEPMDSDTADADYVMGA